MKHLLKTILCFGLVLGSSHLKADSTNDQSMLRDRIVKIEKKVVDLTWVGELFLCEDFLSLRQHLKDKNNRDEAAQVVDLVKGKQLTMTQRKIGIYLLSGLSDKEYWKAAYPLLFSVTDRILLTTILYPGPPYHAGYANAYNVEPYKTALEALSNNKAIPVPTRRFIGSILSGEVAKNYKECKLDQN